MDLQGIKRLAGSPTKKQAPTGVDWLDKMVEKDATRAYYPFLYRLAQKVKPNLIVELGVQTGRATAHLAMGAPNATVVGVDPEPWDLSLVLDRCPNVEIIKDHSQNIAEYYLGKFIDILFIDSAHTHAQVATEYKLYRPLMSKGGIILFDDINLDDEMRRAWAEIPEPKLELNHLHFSGFGVKIC